MDETKSRMLAAELGSNEQEQELWHKFLLLASSLTHNTDVSPLREAVCELVRKLGEATFGSKLQLVIDRIPSFPIMELLPLVLEACGQLRRDSEQAVRELQHALSELATPIIRIWTDVLLVPLIGNFDGDRAQALSEKLLDRASATRAKVVIVDVTGVPMIETAVGGFLIEMFSAVKLLGAQVILTGIKPEVAHTLVKLGIDFRMVSIARDLEDALRQAIAMVEEEKRQQRHIGWAWSNDPLSEGGEQNGH